jgi:hypothetical protein
VQDEHGEPSFVTFSTKAVMAFFAAPSFHEGSGSWARTMAALAKASASRAHVFRMIFMGLVFRI